MKDRMDLKDMDFPVVELKNGDFMKDGLLHCGVCG